MGDWGIFIGEPAASAITVLLVLVQWSFTMSSSSSTRKSRWRGFGFVSGSHRYFRKSFSRFLFRCLSSTTSSSDRKVLRREPSRIQSQSSSSIPLPNVLSLKSRSPQVLATYQISIGLILFPLMLGRLTLSSIRFPLKSAVLETTVLSRKRKDNLHCMGESDKGGSESKMLKN